MPQVEKVPCEFITNFDPTYPVILGGLLSNEDNIGYIQVSVVKLLPCIIRVMIVIIYITITITLLIKFLREKIIDLFPRFLSKLFQKHFSMDNLSSCWSGDVYEKESITLL